MEPRCVKLRGDVEGTYMIEGSLPAVGSCSSHGRRKTSLEAILDRADGERLSPKEFDKYFGDLPTDGEG